MAEATPIPDAWIGQETHLRYANADKTHSLDCTIKEVNDRGVCVTAGDAISFFPWSSVVKIDLGHAPTKEERRALRVRR